MPIGTFARRSGLTPSALRFYADSGLLRPAETDPVTGYRHYREAQVPRAAALRGLREIGMPLTAVAEVLDAAPGEASRLVDAHVARVLGEAAGARRTAAAVTAALTGASPVPVAVLKGPVLADAVEQVLTATATEPGLPVLAGLRVEVAPEAVTLTATDRYRLSTRTLVPDTSVTSAWAATLHGDDLRAAAPEVRRSARVRLEATPHGVWLRLPDREDPYCRVLAEEFPDHRAVLGSLPEATTRATVRKEALLRALEDHPGERIALRFGSRGVHVLPAGGRREPGGGTGLPAAVTGDALTVGFSLTTLYPAASTAVGPDVLLDLRGPDRPVTVRSADRGDLTTLAMPVALPEPDGA
ncbi:MerR family transcriptional regulator [Streptomyces sp. NPDC015131]|uniref:DNA polymerase III subunit beta family protein n=1 Tax=Streptomyces sp. NPDC015131 TaxID=3364941 RepID=UPI0036FFE090